MHSIYAHINRRLVKWCIWKYRKFKRQAIGWVKQKWQEKTQALFTVAANPVVLLLQSECIKASNNMIEEPYDGRLSSTVL
jgi:hypothetical protein